MTALPSFVELMATLGLQDESNPSQKPPSPTCSPRLSVTAPSPTHIRSRSNPTLRESTNTRSRNARFSPYASSFSSGRRGSTSSTSSAEVETLPPIRSYSTSPRPGRRLLRRASAHLSVNVYGSSSDLPANTPISSYVRRKTPGTSPTSPTFSSEISEMEDSPTGSPMPFSLPTLPPLFPRSPNSDSFPLTPDSTSDIPSIEEDIPSVQTKSLPEIIEGPFIRRNRHTGVRISTPPTSASKGEFGLRPETIKVS